MSLVPRDKMQELRSAAAAAATAATAEVDIQLQTIAYQINEASNTGQYRVLIQQPLLPDVKTNLEAQGYRIKFINNNAYNMEHHALIMWSPAKPGEDVAEPSLNGPKHSNHLTPAVTAFAATMSLEAPEPDEVEILEGDASDTEIVDSESEDSEVMDSEVVEENE